MIQNLLLQIPGLLLAISFHEMAHGYMAFRKGDYTAKMMGRITLNPIKHIDPFGTVLVPLILAFSGAPVFGWAKPVPVSPFNFKSPRKDNAIVSLAGPVSNLLLAVVLSLMLKILLMFGSGGSFITPLARMLFYGIYISVILGVFNLIPVFPLDGSHIITGILPAHQAQVYSRHERYGPIILLVLIFTGLLWRILDPLASAVFNIIRTIFGF